ncbi:hypothetical protein [Athalassotoga saccharophila]|uniref:hypothetical protein n=1 Tax=Athalassotoga saccharophila TaxID=1441386 RepID=UPI00137A6BCF|nr:hypothetical protein [Athalassotoga saccharophila]BBJ27750.1 DNA polymerase beta domain protein [Athalassotoga saccharophila]
MKFITSKEIRNNPAALWSEDETVIMVNGKPKAIVLKAEDDIEEQIRNIKRLRAQTALEKLRFYSVKKGLDLLSDEEIINEIEKIKKEI